MHEELITVADLCPPLSRWRVVRAALSLAIGVGSVTFLLTWLLLAWPTVLATIDWQLHAAERRANLAESVTALEPIIAQDHLVIPIIGVDVPVFYDTDITDAVGKLPDGVVHVRKTARPGEIGNVFILGHSSGYWWQAGQYNQVFALLDKLTIGDRIYVNNTGRTFVYRVTQREVIAPTAVDALTQPTDRRQLTLMTCSPVGTTLNRLLVHATLVEFKG